VDGDLPAYNHLVTNSGATRSNIDAIGDYTNAGGIDKDFVRLPSINHFGIARYQSYSGLSGSLTHR
jgi:hypothetical protein